MGEGSLLQIALLQASQQALENLNRCQLPRWHNQGRLNRAYC
jgi:hypothetical protein